MNYSRTKHSKSAVKNEAGGLGYTPNSAMDYVIMTTGKPGFSEPPYYGLANAFSTVHFSGHISYNADGLTQQAIDIIDNVIAAIKESEDKRDILMYAAYLRNEGKVRITPQIILAVAARCEETRPFVREFAPYIMRRPDEIKEAFSAYRELFCEVKTNSRGKARHIGAIPNCLRKAMADAMSKLSERDILKYDGIGGIPFRDVVLMSYNAVKRPGYPLSKDMFEWVVNGKISPSLEIATAAKEFAELERWNNRAKELAIKAGLTWEVIASKFATGNQSGEVWEWLATAEREGKRLMPYMATIRNLRNFVVHGISTDAQKVVCDYLVENAESSMLMPMRYLSAFESVPVGRLKNAISRAANASLAHLKTLPGSTLVAVDTSGSMNMHVSMNSSLTCKGAASVLGALCFKQSDDDSVIGALATQWKASKNINDDSLLNTAESVGSLDVGMGTNLGLAIKYLQENNMFPERIILLTDGQGWMGQHKNNTSGFETRLQEYRAQGWKGHIHEVHMVDYSTSAAMPDNKCHVFSTYSENIIDMILAAEGRLETPVSTGDTFNVEGIKEMFRSKYGR